MKRAEKATEADNAVTPIKRLQNDLPYSYDTAQAIFPATARALQKYLKVTRQQPRYSPEGILSLFQFQILETTLLNR